MGLSEKKNEARHWSWAATVTAGIQALEITNWRNSVFSFGDLIRPSGTRLGLGVEFSTDLWEPDSRGAES